AYAWNDPLKYVDPSGHSLLGEILGLIVGIVIAIFLPEAIAAYEATLGATLTATSMAVIVGFVGGFVGALIATGSLSAALTAGILTGLTAGLFAEVGTYGSGNEWSHGDYVLAHAAVGCVSGVVSGGNCGRDAAAAALSEIAEQGNWIKPAAIGTWGAGEGAAEAGLVGGATSVITGGKFADGFSVGAAGYLFNSVLHYQELVNKLNGTLTNDQAAAALNFFDQIKSSEPLTADQITDQLRYIAAECIASATFSQTVANVVEDFDNPINPPGLLDVAWSTVKGWFGFATMRNYQWSTDIGVFEGQLTDRFGGAARDAGSRYNSEIEAIKAGAN
ncbi:MAG TPA: hypothetical protein VKJ65_10085, partial [Phycisphaerae bacterium]|nr:hypothetical protein [Phycisphaerae bacterium]